MRLLFILILFCASCSVYIPIEAINTCHQKCETNGGVMGIKGLEISPSVDCYCANGARFLMVDVEVGKR